MSTAATNLDEISLRLRLSKVAREKLAERAARAGEDVGTYASELIE